MDAYQIFALAIITAFAIVCLALVLIEEAGRRIDRHIAAFELQCAIDKNVNLCFAPKPKVYVAEPLHLLSDAQLEARYQTLVATKRLDVLA